MMELLNFIINNMSLLCNGTDILWNLYLTRSMHQFVQYILNCNISHHVRILLQYNRSTSSLNSAATFGTTAALAVVGAVALL